MQDILFCITPWLFQNSLQPFPIFLVQNTDEKTPEKYLFKKGMDRKMRKTLALLLALCLLLTLFAGCAKSDANAGGQEPSDQDHSTPEEQLPQDTPPETPPEDGGQQPDTGDQPADPPEQTGKPDEKPDVPTGAKPGEKPAGKPEEKPATPPEENSAPEEPSSAVSCADIWSQFTDSFGDQLAATSEIDATMLSELYGISTDDLEDYVGRIPQMNVKAEEFFIAKVKDGRMDAVKAGIQKRQEAQLATWEHYLPDQLELVQNYQLVTSGSYVLYAVSENADKAVSLFQEAVK